MMITISSWSSVITPEQTIQQNIATGIWQLYNKNEYIDVKNRNEGELQRSYATYIFLIMSIYWRIKLMMMMVIFLMQAYTFVIWTTSLNNKTLAITKLQPLLKYETSICVHFLHWNATHTRCVSDNKAFFHWDMYVVFQRLYHKLWSLNPVSGLQSSGRSGNGIYLALERA